MTIIYSTALLSLLTHIQLSLIGRQKYIQSVIELEREEKARERALFDMTIASLFWDPNPTMTPAEQSAHAALASETLMSPDTERQYLTLSWWLINVGWKEVGERVRAAVEDVFEG